MKRLLTMLLLLTAVLNLSARVEFTYEGIVYAYPTDDKTVQVWKNPGVSGNVVIPETVEYEGESYKVTTISSYAFYNCDQLESITLPNTVGTIGEYAFQGCRSLNTVNMPNQLREIMAYAFMACEHLYSINIPNSVTAIRKWAFAMSSLESIQLPSSLKYIGDEAFSYCGCLKEIEIPNKVTTIGKNVFNTCVELETAKFPASVTEIGETPFKHCYALRTINVDPDNMNYRSEDGILYTKGWDELICFPSNHFRNLDRDVFEIPSNVRTVDDYAFNFCEELKTVIFPDDLCSIGEYAFLGCKNMSIVTLPPYLTYIEKGAFDGCPLKHIYNLRPDPVPIDEMAFSTDAYWVEDSRYDTATLHVVWLTKNRYAATQGWNRFTNIVDDVAPVIALSHSQVTMGEEEVFQLGIYGVNEDVEWYSSDSEVAYVNECGLIVAMGQGEAVITAKYLYEEYNCYVTVTADGTQSGMAARAGEPKTAPESVEIESLNEDGQMLNVRLTPVGASSKIDWQSSDPTVATIDHGLINTVGNGNVDFTVATDNGLTHTFTAKSNGGIVSGIEGVAVSDRLPENANVYDLTGRCVMTNADAEQLRQLPAGLYIVNGRKLLVK